MKTLIIAVLLFAAGTAGAQNNVSVADPKKKIDVVEASCGQCNFKMEGKGCSLAVRIKDKTYFVDGTAIDEHGDAHDETGFCNTIRKAEVQGKVENNRFKVTYFKLLPVAVDKPKS